MKPWMNRKCAVCNQPIKEEPAYTIKSIPDDMYLATVHARHLGQFVAKPHDYMLEDDEQNYGDEAFVVHKGDE